MAAKHKQNTPAHTCATITAPAQNRQPRYSLKYLQTARDSGQYLTLNRWQYLTLNSERRLLPDDPPPIGSQTATRSEHHLARISEHHLARISEHHLARISEHHLARISGHHPRPPRVRINYGLTVGNRLYRDKLRFSDRECVVSCDTTVRRSGIDCIGTNYGSAIGIAGIILPMTLCTSTHKGHGFMSGDA